jgi:hypothetical protein
MVAVFIEVKTGWAGTWEQIACTLMIQAFNFWLKILL